MNFNVRFKVYMDLVIKADLKDVTSTHIRNKI